MLLHINIDKENDALEYLQYFVIIYLAWNWRYWHLQFVVTSCNVPEKAILGRTSVWYLASAMCICHIVYLNVLVNASQI